MTPSGGQGDDLGERPVDGLDLGRRAEGLTCCGQELVVDVHHGAHGVLLG